MADEKKAIDYLKDAYASNLESQKANLEQDYNKSVADLNEQKIAAQKNTQANLNRTAVEAQKARNNFAETQNAYGLSSGAVAQARLAQNSAEAANMSALRAKQQEQDAQIERQKGLLADQYAAAIREAQATNDYKLAEQLYAEAKAAEKSASYGGYGGFSGATAPASAASDASGTYAVKDQVNSADNSRYIQMMNEAKRIYAENGARDAAGFLREASSDANGAINAAQANRIMQMISAGTAGGNNTSQAVVNPYASSIAKVIENKKALR